jgi:hypothetical protein
MYKILITSKRGGAIIKKKLYESKPQFDKWLKQHKGKHGYFGVYDVTGYCLVRGKWVRV